ncbi:biotin synthase [Streptomyces sp. SPB074]|nr:biotin synthase [Streptomyces sp. SPB074]
MFVGPSAGYLIGWVAGAFVIGLVVHAGGGKPRGWRTALGVLVGGIGVVYAFGIPVQALVTRLPLGKTFLQSLVFLPGDLIKAALATVVTTNLARAYPRAFRNAGWARHRDVVPGEPPRASAEDRPGTGRIVPLRGGPKPRWRVAPSPNVPRAASRHRGRPLERVRLGSGDRVCRRVPPATGPGVGDAHFRQHRGTARRAADGRVVGVLLRVGR